MAFMGNIPKGSGPPARKRKWYQPEYASESGMNPDIMKLIQTIVQGSAGGGGPGAGGGGPPAPGGPPGGAGQMPGVVYPQPGQGSGQNLLQMLQNLRMMK